MCRCTQAGDTWSRGGGVGVSGGAGSPVGGQLKLGDYTLSHILHRSADKIVYEARRGDDTFAVKVCRVRDVVRACVCVCICACGVMLLCVI